MSASPKHIEPAFGSSGTQERGGVTGEASLLDYTGHVTSTGTFNGRRFETTLTSSAFRTGSGAAS